MGKNVMEIKGEKVCTIDLQECKSEYFVEMEENI